MSDKNVTFVCVDIHILNSNTDSVCVRSDCFVFKMFTHVLRFHKRKHIYVNFTVLISECDRCDIAVINRGKMYTALLNKTGCKSDTFCAVVISADYKYLQVSFRKPVQKVIEKLYSFSRWHRLVVNIACDDNTLSFYLVNDVDDFSQDISLVF